MKTIISLCFCLFFTLSVRALDFTVGGLNYSTNTDGVSVSVAQQSTSFSGAIVIPASVSYGGISYAVTSIGDWAFYDCRSLTSVTIPSSVTSIGNTAFRSCSGLTSVTIPDGVTSIGAYAFGDCSGLTSVTIPSSVTSIGVGAFNNCSGLNSVIIPSSVTSIEDLTFSYCSSLTSVTIPSSVTSIGNGAFFRCTGLTSVTIPSSVTSIGYEAFSGCSGLTSVIIPSSVTSIGYGAFSGCSGLTSVTIPSSVTSIGGNAFAYCSKLTSVVIPTSVTSIGNSTFFKCTGLTSVTIPSSVTSIGQSAFEDCRELTSVTIPSSVTSIGASVFRSCSGLTSVTIPSSVTSIEYEAFSGCSGLTSVIIPSSVISIGYDSFSYCKSLTALTIPSSVTSIGTRAFGDCSGLKEIFNDNPTPQNLGSIVFKGVNKTECKLYVPAGSLSRYSSATGWKDFSSIIEMPAEDENTFSIDSLMARPGKQITIPIRMNNLANITAFQCKLFLPVGVTFATDEYDDYLISLSTRATKTHSVGYSLQADSSMMITALSTQNAFFTGSDGDLIYVTVNVPAGMADGDYSLEIKNIILSEKDALNNSIAHKTDLVSSVFTVKSFDPGDSNGDGEVNIMDAVCVIDFILGNNPVGFIFEASDINSDSEINIMDAVGVIDIILGNTVYSAKSLSENAASEPDLFEMDPLTIQAGETKSFALRLKNAASYTAFQLDLNLPEGLSIAKDDEGNNRIEMCEGRSTGSHVTGSHEIAAGKVRVTCYSINNALYRGNEGDFIYITVKADAFAQSNVAKLTVDNIHLVTATREDNQLDAFSGDVFFSKSITGFESADMVSFKAYMQGNFLYIQSPEAQELPLYALDGRVVRMLSVKAGLNRFTDLDNGVYVVKGVKVMNIFN